MSPALVLHIPHASLVIPSDLAADFLLTPEQLDHELLAMTDRYTDELFAVPSTLATTVAFPVSRVVVDPERFADDERKPMAQKGMGVVYTRTSSGRPLRRPPFTGSTGACSRASTSPITPALTTAVCRWPPEN